MFSLIGFAPVILFFTSILFSEVSAQCKDPLIYKLDDIQHLIVNMTAKLTYCTEQLQKQEKQTANLTALVDELTTKIQKQEEENLIQKQVNTCNVTCQAHPVLVKKANQICGSFF